MPGDMDDDAKRRALQRSTDRKTLALLLGSAVVFFALAVGALELWWHRSSADAPPADSSATVPAGPTTTLDPRPAVEQAYRQFLAMVHRLQAAPDPRDPEIPQYTTDRERSALETNLAKYKASGTALRFGPRDRQTILSTTVNGGTATLAVCYVDDSGAFDTATGAVKRPTRVTTQPTAVTMTLEDGAWKVSHVRLSGPSTEGVSPCAS